MVHLEILTLQKLIRSSSDKVLSIEEVERVTGAPQVSLINDMAKAIITQDLDLGMSSIETIKENNVDIKVFVKLLLEKIRTALLMKVAPEKKNLYEKSVSEEDIVFLKGLVESGGDNLNSKVLVKLLDVYTESLKSPLPYLPIELALIDFIEKKS